MKQTNVKELIFNILRAAGCTMEVQDGIVTVTTPEGKLWDFTVPMEVKKPAIPPCPLCRGEMEYGGSEKFACFHCGYRGAGV